MSHPPTTATNHPFDAVTLEILWRRTISAVDEAAKALRRTSFSTLVNESNDFACVLTDAAGQSLAQNTESIPSFIGTLPVTVKEFIRQIGLDNMRPGDVLVTNTPWIATGHLNDITVAKPIFRKGGSWRSRPPPRTRPTSAARCARWSRARCSRRASTSP